jgi:putative polymerase
MLAEAIIMSSSLGLLLIKSQPLFLQTCSLAGALLSYFFFLAAVKGFFDPKPFRDLFIPILFVQLGRAYVSPRLTDRIFVILTLLVIIFGLFEYLKPELYTNYFNVLQYYIAKGATDASAADFINDGLNINGQRPQSQGREIMGWLLTSHRASSIFLEPVTAGNYGALAAAWFLAAQRNIAAKILWVTGGVSIIVLADGRFGLLLFFTAIAAYLLKRWAFTSLAMTLPVIAIFFLVFYILFTGQTSFPNDFAGRLAYSGNKILSLDIFQWFALTPSSPTQDAGYAYAFAQFGLFPIILLWFGLWMLLKNVLKQSYLVFFLVCYMSLSLMTSASFFSIKASALVWFLFGQTIEYAKRAERLSRFRGPRLAT